MKRKGIKTAICLMAGTMLATSCVGSFTMFNKLAKWNRRATDSKFLNELIFLVISPAYAIAATIDVLILNSIEFWTGDNPMAKNIGKTKNIKGDDGLMYAVKYLENGYEITRPNGSVLLLTYNKEENNWYMNENGKENKLIHFNENGTIKAFLNNGMTMDVTPDATGLYELRQAVAGTSYFMATR